MDLPHQSLLSKQASGEEHECEEMEQVSAEQGNLHLATVEEEKLVTIHTLD